MNIVLTLHEWANNERLIHSIKTAFACFIGFILASYIHFQAMQWVAITAIVVMCAQIHVGSVMQKSYMRFLGTLTGSLFAILTLQVFGNSFFTNMAAALIATFFFSFIATSTKSYNESGTLGAVTVVIILFGPNPSVLTGVERFVEISLGILIAAVVSQFILPIHAKYHMQRNQAATLKKIRLFYLNLFSDKPPADNNNSLGNLDEEIVKSLIVQRKLAVEARKEKVGKLFNIDYFQQTLWCEKEIMRSIIFMFHAYQKISDSAVVQENKVLINLFHQNIASILANIATDIEQNKIPTQVLNTNIAPLKQSLNNITHLNQNERVAIDAFIFCAEVLIERLDKLVNLIKNTALSN